VVRLENRSYSAHSGVRTFIWIESDRGRLGAIRETRKTRWAAIKIRQGEVLASRLSCLMTSALKVVSRVRDFGYCMGSRLNGRGTKLSKDLRGSEIFSGLWTDEGPLGENDGRVSVGNWMRTLDAQLRRIRAYGGWTSWNPSLNYLSCIQDSWQLTRRWQFANELRRGRSAYRNFALDKFGSLLAPSNIGI